MVRKVSRDCKLCDQLCSRVRDLISRMFSNDYNLHLPRNSSDAKAGASKLDITTRDDELFSVTFEDTFLSIQANSVIQIQYYTAFTATAHHLVCARIGIANNSKTLLTCSS